MKLYNEMCAYFSCMLMCAYDKPNKALYPFRNDRMLRIVFNNWKLSQGEAEHYFACATFNCSSYHFNTVIQEASQLVSRRAALPLYTVCMDILSSGEPLGNAEKDVIYMLQKHLNISQEDSEATNRFASNRYAALAVTFRAGSTV